jgi:cell division protein FtsW (lipid II flippase)
MKALLRRFGVPLTHPEFALPGLLMLCLGIIAGIGASILRNDLALWLLTALTLSSGVALLLKTRVGTALLIATVALNLCHSTGRIEWSLNGLLSLVLGLAFTATMALFVVAQFQFHRSRGARRRNALVLPPQH